MNREDKAAYDEARGIAIGALRTAMPRQDNQSREANVAVARAAAEVMKACKMQE